MKETLQSVLATLNQIEVHGRKNIDHMLGCMQALEGVIRQLTEIQSAQAKNDNAEQPDNKKEGKHES